LPLDQELTISMEDVEATRPTRSRLRPGYGLTRSDLLLLALMSSDNRAAVALGRTYPGGMQAFVEAMNVKARMLDMTDSRFVEPSGLASENVSSARDLAKLVRAARQYPLISEYSTRTDHEIQLGKRKEKFVNTNGLVRAGSWDIDLSKTGFIREAGRCLVMYAKLAARPVIIVLLDSFGKYTRLADAEQIRAWLEPGYTPPAGLTRAATGSRKAASTKSPRKSAGAIHSVSSPSRVRSEFKTPR
jgi:D-alanyl-D-alanine endopeptidase (penicillin-binding protein 7)